MHSNADRTLRDRANTRTRAFRRGASCIPALAALAFAFAGIPDAYAAIPDSERAVLLNFYTSTNGAGWRYSTNWNGAAGTECTWAGITCDAVETHVVGIGLADNRLHGTLPALDALSALETLNVASISWLDPPDVGNRLTGPIPSLPVHLQVLSASNNALTGSIPALSSFGDLRIFDVSFNQLSGTLPSLTGLSHLEQFVASHNALSGPIPDLTGLEQLWNLALSTNPLTGTIPPSLGTLTNLQYVDLSHTNLHGEIIPLAGMTSLWSFSADSAGLSGPIPDLSRLANLSYFSAYGNQLTGPLPHVSVTPNLEYFDVGRNRLSGSIPPLSGASHLSRYMVEDNHLTGSIPPLVGQGLLRLELFDASNNQLTGSIPSLVGFESTSLRFTVNRNRLTGALPPLQGTNLQYFDAAYNQLTGSIPPLDSGLAYFFVNDNALTGSIPDLSTDMSLFIFDVRNNRLTGSIPSFAGTALGFFSASNNELTGGLPDLAPVADTLYELDVGFNQLSGPLPAPTPALGPSVTLCPNRFAHEASPAWDGATGSTPWYAACTDEYVNLNQFGLTGTWYEPSTSGQGWLLEIMPGANGHGTAFGGWFTYPCSVSGGCAVDWTTTLAQRWYSLQGDVDASGPYATLLLYESEGGAFDAPPTVGAQLIGSVALAFTDCTHGALTFHFVDNRAPDGTIALTRLTSNTTCTPDGAADEPATSNSLLSGAWYDPATSGQGMLFDISTAQNVLFAGWYTYASGEAAANPDAGQRWYSLQASIEPGATHFDDVPIYRSTAGILDYPTEISTVPVGTADITFESCTSLTVGYAFTDGENGGLSGTLHLIRLGAPQAGCTF